MSVERGEECAGVCCDTVVSRGGADRRRAGWERAPKQRKMRDDGLRNQSRHGQVVVVAIVGIVVFVGSFSLSAVTVSEPTKTRTGQGARRGQRGEIDGSRMREQALGIEELV